GEAAGRQEAREPTVGEILADLVDGGGRRHRLGRPGRGPRVRAARGRARPRRARRTVPGPFQHAVYRWIVSLTCPSSWPSTHYHGVRCLLCPKKHFCSPSSKYDHLSLWLSSHASRFHPFLF